MFIDFYFSFRQPWTLREWKRCCSESSKSSGMKLLSNFAYKYLRKRYFLGFWNFDLTKLLKSLKCTSMGPSEEIIFKMQLLLRLGFFFFSTNFKFVKFAGIEAGIPSPPSTASCCRHVTLVTFLITGSHVTTRKLQFAEEGPTYGSKATNFEDFALVWPFNKFYHEFQISISKCSPWQSPQKLRLGI